MTWELQEEETQDKGEASKNPKEGRLAKVQSPNKAQDNRTKWYPRGSTTLRRDSCSFIAADPISPNEQQEREVMFQAWERERTGREKQQNPLNPNRNMDSPAKHTSTPHPRCSEAHFRENYLLI